MNPRTKVLFIAGAGRSGSTLLASIIGQMDGVLNAGEIRALFDKSLFEKQLPCSCGKDVSRCAFWSRFYTLVSEEDRTVARQLLRARKFGVGNAFYESSLYQTMQVVYKELGEQAEVIVDSSKHPMYALALSKLDCVELYILHLVRDPRGMVSSWSSKKGYLHPKAPWKVPFIWMLLNSFTELHFASSPRYFRIRYEDFVEAPIKILKQIVEFCGLKSDVGQLFVDAQTIQVRKTQHILAGNPEKLRFQKEIRIIPRPENIGPGGSFFTLMATFPLAYKYGYIVKSEKIK